MNLSAWQNGRRLVPRWRSYAATLRSRDLGMPNSSGVAEPAFPELLHRLEMFGMAPALVTAAEAVEAAIVCGREEDAVNAARRIVGIDTRAAPLIREQAAALLRRTGHADELPEQMASKPRLDAKGWRRLTRLHPDDPIAWVELALEQTIRKHDDAARKSMSIALHLAPHNRHVLRSASRLYLHLNDAEQAHDLIARNAATRRDPWLMAAEIALAGVADRSPRYFKIGVAAVEEGSLTPHHITELAGALGTEDLLGGNRKRSRKMFTKSMHDPTGNSLAQGEWAAPHFGSEIVPRSSFDTVPEAAEAKALHLYLERKLAEVPEICLEWADADPFSIRPFEFGTTVAGLTEDYATAERLAREGLLHRADAPRLLNSMAFVLASQGKTDEAETFLRRLPKGLDESALLVTSANRGLIAYRQGRKAEARLLYLAAIEGFKRIGNQRMAAQARAYLAREAVLAKEPDAEEILSEAKAAAKPHGQSDLTIVLDHIDRSLGRKTDEPTGKSSSSATESGRKSLGQIRWSTPGLPAQYRMNVLGDEPPPKPSQKGSKK